MSETNKKQLVELFKLSKYIKNISINLGFYYDNNFMGKIAKFRSEKLSWFPAGSIKLFTHTNQDNKSVIYHEIDISIGKYYFIIDKINPINKTIKPHWRFRNLTGK